MIIKYKSHLLSTQNHISKIFIAKGAHDFHEALIYVHELPYRRISQLGNYMQVLSEECGTCSTKHALIKQLAAEVNVDIQLKLGMFLMTKQNMPTIAAVLDEYNLTDIPEGHVYLQEGEKRFDITFPDEITYPEASDFLLEKEISPGDIGESKINFHQAFLKEWMVAENISLSFKTLWACRERCIDALLANYS